MSRLFQHLAFVAAIAVTVAAPAHAADFLKAIDDVPLPPGMTEQGEPVVFESEQGRVVKTIAEGQMSGNGVAAFYEKSLPALGWKKLPGGAFERENERLSISVREPASADHLRVMFELVVKLAGTRLPE